MSEITSVINYKTSVLVCVELDEMPSLKIFFAFTKVAAISKYMWTCFLFFPLTLSYSQDDSVWLSCNGSIVWVPRSWSRILFIVERVRSLVMSDDPEVVSPRPQVFYPSVTDIYHKKNMPKMIYCLHALRCIVFTQLVCSTPKLAVGIFLVAGM